MKKLLFILFLVPLSSQAQRPLVAGWNENKVKVLSSNYYLPAMIYLPSDYFSPTSATKRYPLIYHFHGSGKAGTDTVKVLEEGWIRNISNNGSTSYTHEGVTKTLGTDVPTANDINGNSRTAIIVAVQATSYGVNPIWWPYMHADVIGRLGLRVDNSMIYLYGYSAGNWAATGAITNNTDTTYNRFVSAIIVNSGATQDLNPHSNFKKIADRRIPTLLVVGATDVSYRDQMRKERDTINFYSAPDVALYEEVAGQGHGGFEANALNSKKWSVTGTKSFVEWAFLQKNPYGTIWTPSVGGTSPVANAGADVNVWMLKNTATLTGSASTGTITSITWTKLSGPAGSKPQEGALSTTNTLNVQVNNLSLGTHTFRLTLSDGITTSTDDVSINVYPFKSRLPNPATDTIFLTPSGGEYYFTNFAATYPQARGGTVVYLTQSAGLSQFYFDGPDGGGGGDSVNQMIITAAPGVVLSGAFRCNGQYIKIKDLTFRPNTSTAIAGVVLPSKHRNIEVTNCKFEGSENAIYAKTIVDTMDCRTYGLNHDFYGNYFHHNTISDTRGEGMYLNHTFSDENWLGNSDFGDYTPIKMTNLVVSWNTLRRIGWDGIQTSNAPNVTITHNIIDSTGLVCKSSQLFGSLIGGYSWGRFDSNDVRNTRSAGLFIGGGDTVKARGNYFFNCGYSDIQTDLNCASGNPFTAIYANDNRIASIGSPSPGLVLVVENNCIQGLTSYSGGAAVESRDGNSTTRPGFIRNNKLLDPLSRATSVTIKSNTTGDVMTGNTLAACVGNIPPIAQAGEDQQIIETFTLLLGNTSADADGTISSYLWQQVSGPGAATISNPNQSITSIVDLQIGVYRFRLTVTDNSGAISTDEVEITVSSAVPIKRRLTLKKF